MRRAVPFIVLIAAASLALAAPNPLAADRGLCVVGSVKGLGSAKVAYAAVALRDVTAYRLPGRGALARFGTRNVNRYPTVFGIRKAVLGRDCRTRWYRVQLPMRPNGITGYVPARAVWVGRVTTRIVIDLSERRLTLFRRGRLLLRVPAAVGTSATPTPLGRYYVNQRLVPSDRGGTYGPRAIGISAFSDVHTGWAQGGPIGIHGTNQPRTIGRRATNGCIRLRNPVLRRVFGATLAGTPVIVRR